MIQMNDLTTKFAGCTPWKDAPKSCPRDSWDKFASLHYRGWTLVDIGRNRFAAKDGSDKKLLVCREYTPQNKALAAFRSVVDAYESSTGANHEM